jgi:hypothetical protein
MNKGASGNRFRQAIILSFRTQKCRVPLLNLEIPPFGQKSESGDTMTFFFLDGKSPIVQRRHSYLIAIRVVYNHGGAAAFQPQSDKPAKDRKYSM